MNTRTPPTFIERYRYQSCKQITDPVTGKRVYRTPDNEHLPSVTTILSRTKDMTFLNEWKKRVGVEKAQQITTEASGVGTSMHNNLEKFTLGKDRIPGNNLVHRQANEMANVIIDNGLVHMNEIWAIEQSLYYPGLYSGTTDGIGVFKGTPVIFDYKQTNKPKKEEYVTDYYLQLTAYAMAHNEIHGTDIKNGVIFMCSRDLQYQQFELTAGDFNKYQDMWCTRIEKYYNL